jgi:hypothetical protein
MRWAPIACCAAVRCCEALRFAGSPARAVCFVWSVACSFVCLFARHMQRPASLLRHKLSALRLTSRACNASCAAASWARLSRRLLTSRPFRPFAGLPTWTSFRSSASAFSPQARRRSAAQRSAAHATPSAVAYRTPASLRCAAPACDSSRQRRHHDPVAAGDVRQLSRDRCTRPLPSADANAPWPPHRSGPAFRTARC